MDRAPFLALLEPDLREQVRKRLSRRKIPAGKALYQAGEPADALYLVESGRFRVVMAERPGRERVLQFLGPGEVVSMEFQLPLSSYPLKLRAIVRYRQGLHYGFEFLTLNQEQRNSIQRVCEMLAASGVSDTSGK